MDNTKITGLKINKEHAFKNSQDCTKATGRNIAFTEIQQQLLGYPEVMNNLRFVCIQLVTFEQKYMTSVKLQHYGLVKRPTENEVDSKIHNATIIKCAPQEERGGCLQQVLDMRTDAALLGSGAIQQGDSVLTVPGRTTGICPRLCSHFRWFVIKEKGDHMDTIVKELDDDVLSCVWYAALGRRVCLQKHVFPELVK